MDSLEQEAPVEGRYPTRNTLNQSKVNHGLRGDLVSVVWTQVSGWVKNLERSYRNWISEDLEWTGKVEDSVQAMSYVMTLGLKSEMMAELVYSLANLLVIFNDSILQSALRRQRAQPILKRILMRALSIVETVQVCVEMMFKHYLGERWKWVAITFVSLFKSLSKAVLLFYYRTGLSHCQTSQPLDRKLLARGRPLGSGEGQEEMAGKAWVGSRTSKVVRSIHDDMSKPYDELKESCQSFMGSDMTQWSLLSSKQLLGEAIGIARPIAHLLSMAVFGDRSLKSFFIPLCMDIVSLHLVRSAEYKMKFLELREVTRRKFSLLYYFLRSPVYDDYVKIPLLAFLGYFAKRIPLFGRLINQLMIHLPIWQTTYFYVWAR